MLKGGKSVWGKVCEISHRRERGDAAMAAQGVIARPQAVAI